MCTGSHIALEMTRLLEASGEQAEFFGIINTWAMYTISRLYYVNRMINVARWYTKRLRELAPVPAPRNAAQVDATQRSVSVRTQAVPAEAHGTGNAWIKDVGFAGKNPGLPKLSTRATVLRLKRQPFWRIRDASLGWSIHVDDVDVVPVSGDNHEYLMREPYVSQVAAVINDRLHACEVNRNRAFGTGTLTESTKR